MFAPQMLVLLLAGADTAGPTFNKDVAPVLFDNCVSCHRPGAGGPFSLMTYKDARKKAKLIASVTKSKQMPPWKAGKGDVAFRNERHLSDAQIALLVKWVEAGAPEGNAADLPKAPTFSSEWPLGKPDLVVKMPRGFKVPAEGRDIYRNFALPLGLKEDKWLRAIDFRPTAKAAVHHSLFFLDPSGKSSEKEKASGQVGFSGSMGAGALGRAGLGGFFGRSTQQVSPVGGWAVGAQARLLPEGLAYKVPKGSDLILSTHFHPSGKADEEISTVALYFAKEPPKKKFMGVQVPFGFGILAGINIPAGKKAFSIEDTFELPVDTKAFGVSGHAHYIAKTFKLTATLPDGKKKVLLDIPDWDFAWQEQYTFSDYVALPKGTKLHVKITYDNSADNPRNPTSPPKRVKWGRESTDEMGSMTLLLVAEKEADFARLREGYVKYVRESLAKRGGRLFRR